jgi:hypothetical protein
MCGFDSVCVHLFCVVSACVFKFIIFIKPLHTHPYQATLTLYIPSSLDSSDEDAEKTKGKAQAKESGKKKESSRHRPKGDLEKEKEKLAAVYNKKSKRSRCDHEHLLFCPTLFQHCPTLSNTVQHCPALSNTVQYCPALSNPVQQCPTLGLCTTLTTKSNTTQHSNAHSTVYP